LLDLVACQCPFCRKLLEGELSVAGFDETIANQHYLYSAAMAVRDLRRVPPADRISFVQKRIEEAEEAYDAIEKAGITLSVDSSPTHLTRWKAVLSSLQSRA